MKKRAAALLLCLLVIVQLAAPPARAASSVYFVAVGSNVLPMTDATMPFWSGGYLYVSSSMFTGMVWNSLGISHVPANAKQPLILYNEEDRPLMFDLSKTYAQDTDGNTYYPGAVRRNGNVFVPVSLVASFFGLQYSLIPNVEHGYLVWLRQPGYGLSDEDFADAATYPMATCYTQYLKSRQPTGSTQTPTVEKPAETPEVTTGGKSLYLCMEAGSQTGELLDVLDRYAARAAFFCSPEFLETQGDLLRRMAATGQMIGLVIDAADKRETVEEQLRAGNEALWRATFQKSRLVYIKNGDAAAVQTAEDAGFRCLHPDLDRSDYDLRSVSQAESLLKRVSERRGNVTLWLGERFNAVGARALVAAAGEAGDRCLPFTETT
ncbi:polysaccharide deacetylase family protein [Oscillibacter sp.]|uniref:polysaccharide deacetylase family protein n=1 Tax=Oscillibacter sp. TaxID=1945593 RepID=UPI0026347469|nr:polysaccharide deacetylase family protein [Oscillibacter sp.]MDD3347449.1 polysaccharide deacetylase family protein [Oscillibacter sp.]